jgi:hypothetical protein
MEEVILAIYTLISLLGALVLMLYALIYITQETKSKIVKFAIYAIGIGLIGTVFTHIIFAAFIN